MSPDELRQELEDAKREMAEAYSCCDGTCFYYLHLEMKVERLTKQIEYAEADEAA